MGFVHSYPKKHKEHLELRYNNCKGCGETHVFRYKVEIGHISDLWVAQLDVHPGIIISAEEKESVEEELVKSIDVYLEAFPDKHDRLL